MRVSLDIRGGGVDDALVSPAMATTARRGRKKYGRADMRRAFMNHPRGRYSIIIDLPFSNR